MSHRVSTETAGRSRKGRALLAGGAVLGLGAVATLAAWSDDVWVLSSFTTTPFSIEAAVAPTDGNDWDHPNWQKYDDSVGDLQFKVNPAAMLPGEPVFAPLGLRLSAGETAGNVSIVSAPTVSGLDGSNANFFNSLSLSLHKGVTPSACNLDDVSTDTQISGFEKTPLHDPLGARGQDIVTLESDKSPVWLCFEIELSRNAGTNVQGGSTGAMVWTFHAEPVGT